MRMKRVSVAVVVAGLMLSGCAAQPDAGAEDTAAVTELLRSWVKNQGAEVGTTYGGSEAGVVSFQLLKEHEEVAFVAACAGAEGNLVISGGTGGEGAGWELPCHAEGGEPSTRTVRVQDAGADYAVGVTQVPPGAQWAITIVDDPTTLDSAG